MVKAILQNDYVTKSEFKTSVNAINTTLKGHSLDLRDLKIKVEKIDKSLSNLTGIVLRIEQRNNVYSDVYEMNKGNVNKLVNRVCKLEKRTGVIPPQELLISGL